MVGNGWEMVGVHPTYVLRSGAFLAGAFFVRKKSAPFHKKCLLGVLNKTFLFVIKRPDPAWVNKKNRKNRPTNKPTNITLPFRGANGMGGKEL